MRHGLLALLSLGLTACAMSSQHSIPALPRTIGGEISKVQAAVSASNAARDRLVAQAQAAQAAAAAALRAHMAAETTAKASATMFRISEATSRKSAAKTLAGAWRHVSPSSEDKWTVANSGVHPP